MQRLAGRCRAMPIYTCALQTATRGTGASTALRIRGTLSGSAGSSCPTARIATSAKSVSGWNVEGPAATSRYRKAPEGGRSLVKSVQRARTPRLALRGTNSSLGERGVPESTLRAVSQDDMELVALRQMASDPTTPTHLKLGALNELARRREATEPEGAIADDPLGAMQDIVEKYCPQSAEDRELPAPR